MQLALIHAFFMPGSVLVPGNVQICINGSYLQGLESQWERENRDTGHAECCGGQNEGRVEGTCSIQQQLQQLFCLLTVVWWN